MAPSFPASLDTTADDRLSRSVLLARDYLRAHWARRVALDELARAAHCSKFYLVRKFSEETGTTPGRYHALLRVWMARAFLAAGMAPSAAAYQAGFSDQSHLTRSFKQTFGTTPAAFARAERDARVVPISRAARFAEPWALAG